MTNWIFLLIMIFLFTFQEKEQVQGEDLNVVELKSSDKEYLLEYYEETRMALEQVTEGLSMEQLQYKPAEDRWSIAECMEHIILTEEALFTETVNMLSQPANPERKIEIKGLEEELVMGIEDRSQKFQASAELQPQGMYSDPAEAFQDFEEQREEITDLIEETPEEDLRDHIADSPFGPMDAYRNLLFIAAHTARHTKQIEEVMDDPGFPSE